MNWGETNPWLNIKASEYEGHMSAPNVGQNIFLNDIFKNIYNKTKPRNLAVIGCTTGNGFENVDFEITEKVVGVDINPEFISICRNKFKNNKKVLFFTGDLKSINLGEHCFDMIHCALFFEYVEEKIILNKLYKHLRRGGTISTVLQLPSEGHSLVSETEYKSLEALSSIMRLVDPESFKRLGQSLGLTVKYEEEITLKSGKRFFVLSLIKL